MKTRKVETNTKSKPKPKINNSLRNKSKVKTQTVTSSERVCNRCKSHEIIASIKGHKCPYIGCDCLKCKDYEEKTRRKREMALKRKNQKGLAKGGSKEGTEGAKGSKSESISFVNSLKNKSKKILNKKKSKKSLDNKINSNKVEINDNNIGNNRQKRKRSAEHLSQPVEDIDSPPKLVRQQSFTSPAHTSMANNGGTSSFGAKDENTTYPIKSSAALCAQYLKSCGELSRKLSNYALTEDEMIACFKYSTIRDCLGDVEMAAQKIAYASQEIRLGAAFNIQHPMDEPKPDTNTNTSNNDDQPRALPSEASGQPTNAQMLCSTFNPNFRQNTAINYSPSFTPIRRN